MMRRLFSVCCMMYVVTSSTIGQGFPNTISNCEIDSLFLISLLHDLEIDSLSWVQNPNSNVRGTVYGLKKQYLSAISKKDSCTILLYAAIFSNYIARGLDLEYDYVGNRPRKVGSIITTDIELMEQIRAESRVQLAKHRKFLQFLLFKKKYEYFIIREFFPKKKNKYFRIFIDFLIEEGNYTNPDLLRSILLSEYDFISNKVLHKSLILSSH